MESTLIFDVGFYDGNDTEYYLRKGARVVAFEANPALISKGSLRFQAEIKSGQLTLVNAGIGQEEGMVEFFLNKNNAEWSTCYREAAHNWGQSAFDKITVPGITSRTMFARYGTPHYLKADIEGYDIYVAQELKHLAKTPDYVSFEASHRQLLRELLLAGYDSFKIVDQARVPQQVDTIGGREYRFANSTSGKFGDAAPGQWLSFENIMYLYLRFEGDMFATSVPTGAWWDIHAAKGREADLGVQLEWMRRFIDDDYRGHCGLFGHLKPKCPAVLREPGNATQVK